MGVSLVKYYATKSDVTAWANQIRIIITDVSDNEKRNEQIEAILKNGIPYQRTEKAGFTELSDKSISIVKHYRQYGSKNDILLTINWNKSNNIVNINIADGSEIMPESNEILPDNKPVTTSLINDFNQWPKLGENKSYSDAAKSNIK